MPIAATTQAPAITSPWERFRAQRHFGSLDGLRCLAILPVIWHHGPGLTATGLSSRGHYGVPLFFAISGFLITTLLLRERDQRGSVSLRNFYARRSLRIFPLYYTVLAAYALLLYLRPSLEGTGTFFQNLPLFAVYLTNWVVTPGMKFGFGWSLAVEEQFYATWPALFSRTPPLVYTSLLAAAFLAGFLFDLYVVLPISIAGGCLIALTLHSPQGFGVLWRVLGGRWTPAVCVVAALLAMAPIEQEHAVAIQLALVFLVAASVIREDHFLAPVLKLRWVAYIGTISYGMYLLHELVFAALGMNPFGWEQHSTLGFLANVPLSVLAAGLSYRYFETPFLRMKRRFQAANPTPDKRLPNPAPRTEALGDRHH